MSNALLLLNGTRAMHDRRRLKRGRLLEVYANAHCRKMARKHSLEHGDLDGYLESKHILSFWGENVGCSGDPTDPVLALHKAYLNSPSHRANMLNSHFRKVGLGFYRDGDITWSTQAYRR